VRILEIAEFFKEELSATLISGRELRIAVTGLGKLIVLFGSNCESGSGVPL
jgi:hypothetical protein